VLVVGVVGHRVLADIQKLRRSVNVVVDELCRSTGRKPPDILSALAEGADRLVADAMIARANARLTAVLPLPAAKYREDFTAAGSREDFDRLLAEAAEIVVMRPADSRDDAYQSAANYIVENSNVLVALWDGKPAQGVGGTAHAVTKARSMKLPLVWIKCGNRAMGTMEPTIIDDEGEVTYERFDF